MTGLFTERGIHKLDGFLTQFVVDQEQYTIKVPPHLVKLAVLTEPLSIVEKGIEQIRIIQSRLPWACEHPDHTFLSPDWGKCKTAMVIGAGPLGLLAASLLRLAGVMTTVIDIVPDGHPKAQLVNHIGAGYVDATGRTTDQLVEYCCGVDGRFDIVFEASGASTTALEMFTHMSRSSIGVMTGIPRAEMVGQVDIAQFMRQIVRYNQVVVGSVNSNRGHFEMALRDMEKIDSRFNGVLKEMLTNRYRFEEYQKAFEPRGPEHIKTVIEVET